MDGKQQQEESSGNQILSGKKIGQPGKISAPLCHYGKISVGMKVQTDMWKRVQ